MISGDGWECELTRLLAARVAMMSTMWDGLVWSVFWEGNQEGVMIELYHWKLYTVRMVERLWWNDDE